MMERDIIPEKDVKKVLAAVDQEELIKLTGDLVRINSVWDPVVGTSEQAVATYVADWARARNFAVQVDEVVKQRPNVIINWTGGDGNRKLMFEGHTDVVTPGDISAWQYDPFGAEIVNDRMYGRGTNDTKGNLAAMLVAMDAIRKSGVKLYGSIVGGVLCDEEDLMLGVQDFIRRGHADAITGAVICEPQDGMICTSQKGALRVCYSIKGRMSHGAMPLTGLNTAPALVELILGLQHLETEAIQSLGQDPHLGWPSFTPTVIQAPAAGPPQLNVMPGESRLLVDVRTIPGQSHADLQAKLKALSEKVIHNVSDQYRRHDHHLGLIRDHDLRIETIFLTDRPCTLTDRDDPVVVAAHWSTRKMTRKEPAYAGVPGATDGTYLWALKQIPIVTMGAGDRRVPHQVDEWVDLSQLAQTAEIYALTALHYLYGAE